MCGRMKPKTGSWKESFEIIELEDELDPQLPLFSSLEIRPTNKYPIIRSNGHGGYETALCRWSLVPAWFSKPLSEFKLSSFNAKIEEAADKATFRSAFAKRHCLVPVDYFWEWWGAHPSGDPKKKQRWEIHRADNHAMVFAGIWDRATTPDGEIESFTLMTRAAGADLAPYHTREPVTLLPDEYKAWLDLQPVAGIGPIDGVWPSAPAGTFRFSPAEDIPDPPRKPKASAPEGSLL